MAFACYRRGSDEWWPSMQHVCSRVAVAAAIGAASRRNSRPFLNAGKCAVAVLMQTFIESTTRVALRTPAALRLEVAGPPPRLRILLW